MLGVLNNAVRVTSRCSLIHGIGFAKTIRDSETGKGVYGTEWAINHIGQIIKSTRKNPITKDDIEVKDIKLFPSDTTIKLEIDLKNKSSKDIVGFNIEVELLDESDKRITVISLNTEDTIPAKKEYSFTAFSTIDKSQNKNIKKARIVKIDKNSNDYFDEFQKLDIE